TGAVPGATAGLPQHLGVRGVPGTCPVRRLQGAAGRAGFTRDALVRLVWPCLRRMGVSGMWGTPDACSGGGCSTHRRGTGASISVPDRAYLGKGGGPHPRAGPARPGGGHTGCRAGRGERFCGGGAPGRLGSAEPGRSSCLGGNTAALVECRGTGTSGWGGGGGGRWFTAGGAIAGALGSDRFRR